MNTNLHVSRSQEVNCPVCGATEKTIPYHVRRNLSDNSQFDIDIAKCLSCGTAYLEDASHAFQEDLYSYYQQYAGRPIEELVSPLTLASYKRVLRRLSRLTDVASILDVGCGKGEFVWAAQQAGYCVEGLELSPEAASIAQAQGLPVRKQSLFSKDLDASRWDAITMFEVLEHVVEPLGMIQRATDLLKPGGLLYLTTPNYNSIDRVVLGSQWHVFHPEHISYFSKAALIGLLQAREPRLQILSAQSNNIDPQTLKYALSRLSPKSSGVFSLQSQQSLQSLPRLGIRQLTESSNLARFAKRLINQCLTITGVGSTIVMIAQRRTDSQI